jgi:acetyl esterase/lipase
MLFTLSSTFDEIISYPSFAPFGRLIFPVQREYLFGNNLNDMQIHFYNHIDPNDSLDVVNYMKYTVDSGKTLFYDIYTDEEKTSDPEKKDTGLFFFRGKPGNPFAVTCAGGGFEFVGAIHGSFPLSLKLAQQGYNAFALIYRPDPQKSCEDLAKAIEFIFARAEELKVDTKGYSIWGESAGARMAAYLGSYGTEGFGCRKLPRAAAIIMQYTGHSEYTLNDPPTYSNAGGNDIWHLDLAMEARYHAMKEVGIPVEFKRFEGLPHGYGLGRGTVAEGWENDAVAFWEAHKR